MAEEDAGQGETEAWLSGHSIEIRTQVFTCACLGHMMQAGLGAHMFSRIMMQLLFSLGNDSPRIPMFHGLSRLAWTYAGPVGTLRQPTGSWLGAGNLAYV